MKLSTHTKITFPADQNGAMMFDVMCKAGLLQSWLDPVNGHEVFGKTRESGIIEAVTVDMIGLAAAYDRAVALPRSIFNVSVRPMLDAQTE